MSNEEFDNLKEDLIWEGSRVAVLRYHPYGLSAAYRLFKPGLCAALFALVVVSVWVEPA